MLTWLNEIGDSKVRLIVNYSNNTVREWVGVVKNFDEYGIVLQDGKGAVRAFSWYTCTEISVVE